MQQNSKISIIELERRIISNKDRYKLNVKENKEIKKTLFNQNLLIIGACGSIGKLFTKRIYKFNFKNIYLLDKNENALVELNRDLVLMNNKKIKKENFICIDKT